MDCSEAGDRVGNNHKVDGTRLAAAGLRAGLYVNPAVSLTRRCITMIVGEMVILGRPLHTHPPIPRYFHTGIGS